MRQTYGSRNFLNILAAFAGRAVHVHDDIIRLDFHFHNIAKFRQYLHKRKTRMSHLFCIKRRNAHEPMHTCLGFTITVRKSTGNVKHHALHSRLLPAMLVNDTRRKPLAFEVSQIHAQ
ncbi:MAG: hypothetical protein UY98_C0002G0001 [Candidatus Kaiserbacteria bacterium GW2011_GWA2_58_9]|uniref:Uncharacterized protein n=1 Tax=Candidatus Kaiserbacteria bacterium GW2011_GWA2_58_9 TaxID=1618672 RepID=A0A0G1YXA4_9BACT|nr:MAG: hypothetical protein UY98_C0002G0001 [Candidatus Kaiserbacteria bacterium GW2011_GWA2_58_9]